MRKVLCSPGSYIQEEGALSSLAREYGELGSAGAYLIVDPFIDRMYRDRIVSGFDESDTAYRYEVFGGECSTNEVNRHQALLSGNAAVIGIGGGKTLDTAKAVAHFAGRPVSSAPTAASADAP